MDFDFSPDLRLLPLMVTGIKDCLRAMDPYMLLSSSLEVSIAFRVSADYPDLYCPSGSMTLGNQHDFRCRTIRATDNDLDPGCSRPMEPVMVTVVSTDHPDCRGPSCSIFLGTPHGHR